MNLHDVDNSLLVILARQLSITLPQPIPGTGGHVVTDYQECPLSPRRSGQDVGDPAPGQKENARISLVVVFGLVDGDLLGDVTRQPL
jgi:hypothetical protein